MYAPLVALVSSAHLAGITGFFEAFSPLTQFPLLIFPSFFFSLFSFLFFHFLGRRFNRKGGRIVQVKLSQNAIHHGQFMTSLTFVTKRNRNILHGVVVWARNKP